MARQLRWHNLKSCQKNLAKPKKQKGKKERGLGKEIFALLQIKLERFRFSQIKRRSKQKIFQILLKEKVRSAESGERAPVRLRRISRQDFFQKKFGFYPKDTAKLFNVGVDDLIG